VDRSGAAAVVETLAGAATGAGGAGDEHADTLTASTPTSAEAVRIRTLQLDTFLFVAWCEAGDHPIQ
jgi:hypothetical protein